MSRTTLRRHLIAGALAASLTLAAGTAPASARELGASYHAWHWLQDLWTQGISALWAWHGRERPNTVQVPASGHIISKEGPGLDPNGTVAAIRLNPAGPDSGSGH